MMETDLDPDAAGGRGSALEVFGVFLGLGLTSFGGPIAHLSYFHRELVERRRWIQAAVYADVVALCQCLPGPTSSQVGIALARMAHALCPDRSRATIAIGAAGRAPGGGCCSADRHPRPVRSPGPRPLPRVVILTAAAAQLV